MAEGDAEMLDEAAKSNTNRTRQSVTDDASSILRPKGKKTKEKKKKWNGESKGEDYRRGGLGNKKRDTKNEKGMKMTETDLTIKQTLELDFLFWQTAIKRRREKNI